MDKNIWCGHKGAKVATVGLYISTSSQKELLSWLLNHRTIFVQTAFRKIFCLQEVLACLIANSVLTISCAHELPKVCDKKLFEIGLFAVKRCG